MLCSPVPQNCDAVFAVSIHCDWSNWLSVMNGQQLADVSFGQLFSRGREGLDVDNVEWQIAVVVHMDNLMWLHHRVDGNHAV